MKIHVEESTYDLSLWTGPSILKIPLVYLSWIKKSKNIGQDEKT